jgi:hypothetical protein
MAAFATTIQRQSSAGLATTYLLPNHTALKPELLIQKRTLAVGKRTVAEDQLRVVKATEDVDGVTLVDKIDIGVTIRRPIAGDSTDVDTAVAYFRDFVASDEFTARIVAKQLDIQE